MHLDASEAGNTMAPSHLMPPFFSKKIRLLTKMIILKRFHLFYANKIRVGSDYNGGWVKDD